MHLPPLTIKLLWGVLGLLLLPFLVPREAMAQLMLWPMGEASVFNPGGDIVHLGFMPWQLLTHVLINPGLGGILFLGLTLVFFGAQLEHIWGTRKYGQFLLTVTLGGGLLQLLLISVGHAAGLLPFAPVAGANATLYGILFAVAYLNPNQRVMLLIPPIPMKMRNLVIALVAFELVFGVFGSTNGLAHLGFLGGMLVAWLMIRYWRGQPPFRPRGPRLVR